MFTTREKRQRGSRGRWLGLGLIILLGFGLRLHQLDRQSLWWDEIATLNRAVIPFEELVANLLAKTDQVPLYFLLMRLWTLAGTGELVLRFFSVIWGVLSIALIFRIGRQIAGLVVGLAAAFLLAISPFHIWYSQEARTYSLLLFLILLAHWFLFRLLCHGRLQDWLGYTLCLVSALFSHYFTVMVLVAHYLFFALHFRHYRLPLSRWLVAAGIVGVIFLTWLSFLWLNGQERLTVPFWIPYARWYDPFLTLLALSAGRTIDPATAVPYIVLIVYLLGLAMALFLGARQPGPIPPDQFLFSVSARSITERLRIRVLYFWLIVPLLFTWLISLNWPLSRKITIYNDRYLIIILPAMILLAAWGLAAIVGRGPRLLLPVLLAVAGLASLPALNNLYSRPEYARQDWRGALTHVRTSAEPGDALLALNDSRLPLIHYPIGRLHISELPPLPEDSGGTEAFNDNMVELVTRVGRLSDRAWVLTVYYNNDQHGFAQARNQAVDEAHQISPHLAWLDSHAVLLDEWLFPGIRLSLYYLPDGE
jgi:mannosyltransferase